MRYEVDTHTHTLVSGHAYNTILEMTQAAVDAGLKALAITDHTSGIPGAPQDIYFQNFIIMPQTVKGIRLLMGAEVNILNDGTIDLSEKGLRRTQMINASIHRQCFTNAGMEGNTEAVLKVFDNPYVDILCHPDDSNFPLDYERIVKKAAEKGVIIEVNENSYFEFGLRQDCRVNTLSYLKLCKQYGVPVALGSDAHFMDRVGAHAVGECLLREAEFPEDLVVNTDAEKLIRHLKERKQRARTEA